MRLLLRKAVRDLREAWALLAASSVLAAMATAIFVAFMSAAADIRDTREDTYARLAFLDFTLHLRTGPDDLAEAIRALPGVSAAEGRLVADVHLALPPGEIPSLAGGIAVGLHPKLHPAVNDVHLDEGRMIEQPRGEALVERRFAEAHRIRVGDRVQVAQRGLRFALTVVGLVSSPEYIWPVVDPADPRPSARRTVLMFVSQLDAERLYGGPGMNEVSVRVTDEAMLDRVMREAEHLAGGRALGPAVPRSAQPSHRMLVRDEATILAFGGLLTAVFLCMTGVMAYSALTQLVARQRRQVGVMLACGCEPRDIALHFLATCAMSAGAGAVVGAAAGAAAGAALTRLYSSTVGLPFVVVRLHPGWMAAGVALVLALAVFTGLLTVGRLLDASPSTLLRTALSPIAHSPRVAALERLPLVARLPVRRLLRQPARSAVMGLGAVFSVALLFLSLGLFDTQRATLAFFFEAEHRYDIVLGIRSPLARSALPPLLAWPGVREVEALLRRRCILDSGKARREAQVWGVPPDGSLLRSYDTQGRLLPDDDLLHLSRPDATALHVQKGDLVGVRIAADRNDVPTLWCRVGDPLYDPVPSPPRLPLHMLQQLAARSEGSAADAVNMLLLAVEPGEREQVRTRLELLPQTSFATDVHEVADDVGVLLRVVDACFVLLNVLAGLLTFVLLVGGITVSAAERQREAALLCALGVPDRMQMQMLLLEVGLLWALGVVLGCPLGYGLGQWMLSRYDSELLQLTMQGSASAAALTLGITGAISLLAALAVSRLLLRVELTAIRNTGD